MDVCVGHLLWTRKVQRSNYMHFLRKVAGRSQVITIPLNFQDQLGLSPKGQYGRFADGRLTYHFYRYINPSFISPNSSELDKVVNLTDQFYILMAKGPLSTCRLSK